MRFKFIVNPGFINFATYEVEARSWKAAKRKARQDLKKVYGTLILRPHAVLRGARWVRAGRNAR